MWVDDVRHWAPDDAVHVVVGNKVDLRPQFGEIVTTDEGKGAAKGLNALFFETSAQSGECVERCFFDSGREAVHRAVSGLRLTTSSLTSSLSEEPIVRLPSQIEVSYGCCGSALLGHSGPVRTGRHAQEWAEKPT